MGSLGGAGMLLVRGVRLGMKVWGPLLAIVSACMWGLSGTAAQYLFQHSGIQAGWLVTIRMGVSGVMLVGWGMITRGVKPMMAVWTSQDRRVLVVFGIAGLLGVQYTYLAAIQAGNAASATLLQYVGPTMVTLWVAVHVRTWPRTRQMLAVGLTLGGTWLVVSSGQWRTLAVPPLAMVLGLLSALALAFYTLYPMKLLSTWGTLPVVGWGMLIGSLSAMVRWPVWVVPDFRGGIVTWALMAFIVVFGTLLSFSLYLMSLSHIAPSTASVLTSAEPLVATWASVLWLHVHLGMLQDVGAGLIILGVVLLALRPEGTCQEMGIDQKISV